MTNPDGASGAPKSPSDLELMYLEQQRVNESNTASAHRLSTLADRSDDDLSRAVDEDWTVSALLAHIAFWDRLVVARWQLATERGEPLPGIFPQELIDVINAAQLPEWRAIAARMAVELGVAAANAADAFLIQLDWRRVDAAHQAGFNRLVDRSQHRDEHLEAIERAIGRAKTRRPPSE